MLATTGSLLLDECNIACSLNYGAALMRGISENVDKMNMIPQLLLLMNCGKCSDLHGRRYDMPRPRSVFSNTSPTVLEMFIIVINILSGSGDLSDTRAWKGLIKRSYCRRSPCRDTTLWLMVCFTADKKSAGRLRPGRTALRNRSKEIARYTLPLMKETIL